jgi:hypothetical protein
MIDYERVVLMSTIQSLEELKEIFPDEYDVDNLILELTYARVKKRVS